MTLALPQYIPPPEHAAILAFGPRPVLSASQVETWLLCQRKRFLRNALGIKAPPHPSAIVGTAVHRQQELLLKHGTEPDGNEVVEYLDRNGNRVVKRPAQILQNGRHLLPPPGVAVAEGDFTMETPGAPDRNGIATPVRWRGAMDWVACWNNGLQGPAWLPPTCASRDRPNTQLILGDAKTTGNAIYAKTEEDLVKDVQANLYAYRLMRQYPVDIVYGNWVYFLTDENPRRPSGDWVTQEHRVRWANWLSQGKPLAWAVGFVLTRPAVDAYVAWLDTVAEEIFRLHVLPEASSLQNSKACSAYGGCPYQKSGRCEISAAALYDRLTETGDSMGIADMQAALAAQMGAPAPTLPALSAPPAPQAAPAAPSARPAYWLPGDPLNEAQQLMAAGGKPLWIVAVAGSPPTPTEIAMAWPAAQLPVRVVDAGGAVYGFAADVAPSAPPVVPIAVTAPAAPPAAPVVMTPPGVPERGTINAPEAPATAPATPEQAAASFAAGAPPAPPSAPSAPQAPAAPGAALDREALKAEAVRRGLMALSDRFGAPRIAQLLAEDDAKRAGGGYVAPTAPSAPAAPPAAPSAPAAPPLGSYGPEGGADHGELVTEPGDKPITVLLVNTLPLKSAAYDLFTDAAIWAMAKFREVHKLPHYALVEYGKGIGVFASYVEQYYVERRPAGGAVYVDTRSREGADALATLERLASEVYRGH